MFSYFTVCDCANEIIHVQRYYLKHDVISCTSHHIILHITCSQYKIIDLIFVYNVTVWVNIDI